MPTSLAVASCLLACTMLVACAAESATDGAAREEPSPQAPTSSEPLRVVGQLLLPGESGRGGVEVHVWFAESGGEERQLWILPGADGRFERDVAGDVVRVSVSAGSEVHRIDAVDVPGPDSRGQVDLGVIDLRDRVVARQVRIRDANAAPGGVVRAGLWIGPPHRGPGGELPSLGSRQFPPLELGGETEWLLPPAADALHILVERPAGPGRGLEWRSGVQRLFGPYGPSDFPLELVLD